MSKRKRTGTHALVFDMYKTKQELMGILQEGCREPALATLEPAASTRPEGSPSFFWSAGGPAAELVRGEHITADPELMARWVLSLQMSESMVITRDITEVVRVAAEQLPEELEVSPVDLYLTHGYLHFEVPIIDGHNERVRALTWNDGFGDDGKGNRVRGLEIGFWRDTQKIERDSIDSRALVPPLNPYGGDFLPYGSLAKVGFDDVPDQLRELVDVDSLSILTRFVIALQSFLRDGLPAVSSLPVPKSLRPSRVPAQSTALNDVSIITLRARNRVSSGLEAPTANNESGRHLTHRHVVRGHWHRYWVNPGHELHSGMGDQPELKARYLMPYIKGPKDAPFAHKEKAYAINR